MTIAPYVLIKREQVLLALEYLGHAANPVARADMCDRMRRLNHRERWTQTTARALATVIQMSTE